MTNRQQYIATWSDRIWYYAYDINDNYCGMYPGNLLRSVHTHKCLMLGVF